MLRLASEDSMEVIDSNRDSCAGGLTKIARLEEQTRDESADSVNLRL